MLVLSSLSCPSPSNSPVRHSFVRAYIGTMPSLIPLDNLLGAFFLGVVLSSMCEAASDFFLPEIDETEAGCTA